MHGNTMTRSLHAIRHMAMRPNDGIRWVRNRIDKRSALDLAVPWISWPCIDFLRERFPEGSRVFEWGGGGSTVFFLRLGGRVTTVESSAYWRDQISTILRDRAPGAGDRLELRYVPAEEGGDEAIQAYVESVRDGAPWDLILVDGLQTDRVSRVPCVHEAKALVRPGGLVVVDDAWRVEYQDVPSILEGFERWEFWGLGPGRQGVTKTDVYRRPEA